MNKKNTAVLFFLLLVSFSLHFGCTKAEFRGRENAQAERGIEVLKHVSAGEDTLSSAERYDFEKDRTEGKIVRTDTTEMMKSETMRSDTTSRFIEEFDNESVSSGYTVGYRIQIFATKDLEKARAIAADNEKKLGIHAYVQYEGELYKVRLGDFSSREKALEWKERLRGSFPDCWIVQTTITK